MLSCEIPFLPFLLYTLIMGGLTHSYVAWELMVIQKTTKLTVCGWLPFFPLNDWCIKGEAFYCAWSYLTPLILNALHHPRPTLKRNKSLDLLSSQLEDWPRPLRLSLNISNPHHSDTSHNHFDISHSCQYIPNSNEKRNVKNNRIKLYGACLD